MVRRGVRPVIAALAVVGWLASCSTPEPTEPPFQERLQALRAIPAGDAAWRDALSAAGRADRTDELEALARELAAADEAAWQPHWTIGKCIRRAHPEEAVTAFEEALRRADEARDPVGVSASANDLGWLAYLKGEFEAGERHYGRSIEAGIEAERQDLEAFARNNLAGLMKQGGQYVAAAAELERAERLLIAAGRESVARSLAHNRATILLQLGDARGARELLERVHGEAAANDAAWDREAAATVLGNLHRALGQVDDSRRWYAEVSERFGDLRLFADLGLARMDLQAGLHEVARERLRGAVARVHEGESRYSAALELFLAEAEWRTGDPDAALARITEVREQAQGLDAGEIGWIARWIQGKVLLHSGRVDEGIATLETAVELAEAQSAPLDPLGSGLQFMRERTDPYVELAAAHAERGNLERALQLGAAVKARALRHALPGAPSGESGAGPRELQAGLDADEWILDYLIGEDLGLLLVVGRDEVLSRRIDGRHALAPRVLRFRDSISNAAGSKDTALDATAREHGRELREALLGPIEPRLSRARRIYVVPDRELALLPFAALPESTGDGYLGDRLEVALLPMIGVATEWAGQRAPVLLAGKPQPGENSEFGELPWAAYELSRLQELWGTERSEYIGGEQLTQRRLLDADLGSFRTVHLATHAVASTRDPRRCGVILSGGERLGFEEISRLSLNSNLVVLSACRTGQGELLPGEGVVGLGWAFLRAGARGIVVSQWTVDDVASARLMIEFHRRLRDGAEPVGALAGAQRELRATYPHPRFWAPFSVVLRPD
ncbi:MAG: CHAT domain-containing protein [bacterium]|nr:CHAT domain-containing protein [bacterium]